MNGRPSAALRRGRVVALIACVSTSVAVAFAASPVDHVCGDAEATSVACASGSARWCGKDGTFAACGCPPGMSAKGASACSIDPSAKPAPICVVPDASIATSLGAALELGELEVPSLPQLAPTWAVDTASALDAKLPTLAADDVVKLAAAHESLEGAAAYQASQLPKAKAATSIQKRDAEIARAIEVRRAFVARFPKDARLQNERLSLARSLLRRAAYAGAGPTVATDRASAESLLSDVVTDAPATVAARTAAFILGEQAARRKEWSSVLLHDTDVVKWALPKTDVDDHAYLAAAYARIVQARLGAGDPNAAKGALGEAITAGLACAPRAECVSASAGARGVLAATWGATGSAARTMMPLLTAGKMPRQERVRPLLQLASLEAAASGAACATAAEEARAYAQVTR